MTELVVRKLLIDLNQPFARHWNGGDAFASALFNALSLSFPAGEQFFMDSVRAGLQHVPETERTRLAREVQGFVGQEATHRRLHHLMNQQLLGMGYRNHWEARFLRRIRRLEGQDPRHAVAVTAATEHFTSLLAHWLLTHPQWLAQAEPRLRTLWLWHASEEAEHRSTAFDVYLAMGGNAVWRIRMMRLVSFYFVTDLLRQTLHHLWVDGQLFKWATWRSAGRLLLGRQGLLRANWRAWRDYFRADFHPSQHDGEPAHTWLAAHSDAYTVVSRP